jgi:hypothetical protein
MPTLLHRYLDSLLDTPAGETPELRRSEYTLWQRYWMSLTGLRPRAGRRCSAAHLRQFPYSLTPMHTLGIPPPRSDSGADDADDDWNHGTAADDWAHSGIPRPPLRSTAARGYNTVALRRGFPIAAVICAVTAVLAGTAVSLVSLNGASAPSPDTEPSIGATSPVPMKQSIPPFLLFTEFTRGETPVFRTPSSEVSIGGIPSATEIEVSCFTPNRSGIPGINDFYFIFSGQWRSFYAPANAFTNGAEPGSPNAAAIDPRVPRCKA